MKKIIIGIIIILVVAAALVFLMSHFADKSTTGNEIVNTANVEKQVTEPKNLDGGSSVIVTDKEITIVKGSKSTFVVTFTNPDESAIREYIKCKDQDDIVLVKYTDIENKKTTVEVEGLKAGSTEIIVSDYTYPELQEIVKVNVIELL